MKVYFFILANIFAILFSNPSNASQKSRFEAVRDFYLTADRRAEFSDFEKIQKNGAIKTCVFFYESEPDVVSTSAIIYMSRKKEEAGPAFPPLTEKKVIILSKWHQPEKIFDQIKISANQTELISSVAATSDIGGSPVEIRFRIKGDYITTRSTVVWDGKTFVSFGYCWK